MKMTLGGRNETSIITALSLLLWLPGPTGGAQTVPVEGLRQNTPAVHAFVNARITTAPGKTIEKGVLVIRDGAIQAVGRDVQVPADARRWDMSGMHIYPGLIDGYSDYGLPKPPPAAPRPGDAQPTRPQEQRGPAYWIGRVLAHQNAADLFAPDPAAAEKLRSQGIVAAAIVPAQGIFRGSSSLVSLGDGKPNELILRERLATHVSLTTEPEQEGYPQSLMGVIAAVRQALYDARWYAQARAAFTKNASFPRPELNEPLAVLAEDLRKGTPFIIDARDEIDLLRADQIAREFSLDCIIRGSGHEYKRLAAVKASGRSLIVPLNFPEAPAVQTPEEALHISLADLCHWDAAPENPARLQESGIRFAFTTAMLKDPSTFLSRVRAGVQRGLTPEAALASLTTVPAVLFGVENQLGSIAPGKAASFIVTDADLFSEKASVRESWIDGKRYVVKAIPEIDPRGSWQVTIEGGLPEDTLRLLMKGDIAALRGTVQRKKKEVNLTSLSLAAFRVGMSFPGDSVGFLGIVRMTGVLRPAAIDGQGEWSDGRRFAWSAVKTAPFQPDPDTAVARDRVRVSFPPVFPPGEFGRHHTPDQPPVLLVKRATIWTCGPRGRMEDADMLIEKGKITRVGSNLAVPPGALVIDATGKHVTPGIIDAHSHMAGTGALNEAAQAVSAETRVGDVLDPDDISIYRALAGGLTVAHILHGSANPIGGQCQLMKLRWGLLPEEMKFEGAPPTIKFALGENVKQSNWGDRFTTRYPQTRMGVEQIMRDRFSAALDHEKAWQRWENLKSGIPPRRDLELDALLEVLRGKRLVHCHAYRQDEVLMMMRVAEDYGFRINTFQHILEGYKVADIMAKHGAGASSFSDWWAYKLEVYDAIPHNGALMHDQGVLVSFNSDSDELARRLNLEAAKAVKYGGIPEEDALKFVTLYPARQLRVEQRVGSLEPGKDADFAVWSGSPLSAYTICEQTWIDGRRYFDRQEDRQLVAEVRKQHAALVQKVLASPKPPAGGPSAPVAPREPGSKYPECLPGEEVHP